MMKVKTDGDGNAEKTTSGSLMTKLDNETREARISDIMSQLSEQLGGHSVEGLMGMSLGEIVGGRVENPGFLDIINAVGGVDDYLYQRYVINSAILLDHLDIRFSPHFGEDEEEESTEEMFASTGLTQGGGAVTKAGLAFAIQKTLDDDDEEWGEACEYSACGNCRPVIEYRMWQGLERNADGGADVSVAGGRTLLMNIHMRIIHEIVRL